MERHGDQDAGVWIGLLRAVNVGGSGKLAMNDLRRLCEELGFEAVRTYIASGNVVLKGGGEEPEVKEVIEAGLERHMGARIDVMVRSPDEIEQVLADDPFPDAEGNRVGVVFLDDAPPADLPEGASGLDREQIALGRREIYVHYPDGMGRSKLKLPLPGPATTRNRNTVAKLAEMARETPI